jgi:hypothetical protein
MKKKLSDLILMDAFLTLAEHLKYFNYRKISLTRTFP